MSSVNVREEVLIVEYEPKWAQAVAEMWNRSQESWGGGNRVRTAESVTRELENAGNLKVFLAVDGDEVIGFCSFSPYKMDEGALYVPLLNVRPDYHGHKVGRSLILKAVETTVEMGWPRLDLFTWAGNTKAVPMYKKCGFFWERKDNTVHLMNFIPTVLQTEALKPYLDRLDWYADSVRPIEVKPDGRRESGFDYFEYSWEKEGSSLRVEFEKTGRGLRLIESDDYSIHAEIATHDLVFGCGYPVRYVIRNKSGAPLECTVKGRDDKNIRFDLEKTVQVQDTVTVEGEFFLDPVLEEQSDWKTHPVVTSEWRINGKRAEFRTGIAPKFPAKVKLEVKEQEQYLDVPELAYLTFENHYDTAAVFSFSLPEASFIEFQDSDIELRIPAKEKRTVAVSYTLKKFGLYSETVKMTAKPEGGAAICFERKLHAVFKGNAGRFGGDAGDNWLIVNGPYTIGLNKTNNDLWASHYQGTYKTWWISPRLGKPYSQEFSKKKAEEVRTYKAGDQMVLEADYQSEDFPGITFTRTVLLSSNGMAEHYYEVRNASGEAAEEDLFLIDAFFHSPHRLVLPYGGEYYDLKDPFAADYDDWDIANISENWLYSAGENLSHGFMWHPSGKLVKTEWHFGIEYALGSLADGEIKRTPSTRLPSEPLPTGGISVPMP
ncbi:GNAT family N-acetyltransferase [Gorillibacterium massiliense]|uniref:GNAT family N-acetyltransferase n=1 Tax=Gorillibacterium massiliense TaxID=1280390 RepID=UPI0004B9725A|nr:GNAT family N-acetyltransferase [Gorillibacterium massiliense]